MGDFWYRKKVLVTGGSGFIGSHLVERLVTRGAEVTATVRSSDDAADSTLHSVKDDVNIREADLSELSNCLEVCRGQEAVLSIAHVDGSVAFKRSYPALILRQNMLITLNMLEAACRSGAERFLLTSSAEVYPPGAPSPTPECEGFDNLGEQLDDGYAWSKRMSEFAAKLFAKQYGIKVAIARPNNVYGPGDYYDVNRGRVIPMFIRKALSADEPILIWGTGEQVRTFLYVDDVARGMLDLTERYATCDPVNLGGDDEISVRRLAELIAGLSGSRVEIRCDSSKPAGPARRICDISKAKQVIGFEPAVKLEEGLRRTIDCYNTMAFARSTARGVRAS